MADLALVGGLLRKNALRRQTLWKNNAILSQSARRDANDMLKDVEGLPEDDLHRGRDEVQKHTDSWTSKVDALADHKEKEILEV